MSKSKTPVVLSYSLSSQPPDWPLDTVPFLSLPRPSPLLTKPDIIAYCSPPLVPPPNDAPEVYIRKLDHKDHKNHPAKGQYGLFNGSKELDKGTWIRDYLGTVHTEPESDLSSSYDVTLSRTLSPLSTISIDATKAGNESRFVNDYRQILLRPNAVFELREWDLPGGRGKGSRMAVWAANDIPPGKEICVSYGRAFWDERRKEDKEKRRRDRKREKPAEAEEAGAADEVAQSVEPTTGN